MDVVLSLVLGFIASYLVWHLTYCTTFSKVIFAEQMMFNKPIKPTQDSYRYRIKIQNIGSKLIRRELIDVKVTARLCVKGLIRENVVNYCYPSLEFDGYLPILRYTNQKRKDAIQKWSGTAVFTLITDSVIFEEFSKEIYAKEIRDKALAQTISIYDILSFYENSWLNFYVFGNDGKTGSRKIFISKQYYKKDLIYGSYDTLLTYKRHSDEDTIETNNDI